MCERKAVMVLFSIIIMLVFAALSMLSACVLCPPFCGVDVGGQDDDTVLVSTIPDSIIFMGSEYFADVSAEGEINVGELIGYLINAEDYEKYSAEYCGAEFAVDALNSVYYAYGGNIFGIYSVQGRSIHDCVAVDARGVISLYVNKTHSNAPTIDKTR